MIDVQWPGDVPTLVPEIERRGYHRFWVTEHHSPYQSGSPTVLAGVAAQLTRTLRIGTAGVLLGYRSPLSVAEDFKLLECLFPGRIDLGVTRGAPPPGIREALEDGRPAPTWDSYAARITELVRLVRGEPAPRGVGGAREGREERDRVDGGRIGPHGVRPTAPELWICGMSPAAAALAASLGTSFAFHENLERNLETPAPVRGPALLDAYRRDLVPRPAGGSPRAVVVTSGLCARDTATARALWRDYTIQKNKPLQPSFLGTPEACRDALLAIARGHEVDELVIQSHATTLDARLTSYRLLAEALGLEGPA
ncbi:MAG TPA: LLM class flavin-dependent oxidoreductase [Kofleriaceae bacterium]|nr:LLM class flavin-dependent oxidoreductase [Kofleriaceae bacterium]